MSEPSPPPVRAARGPWLRVLIVSSFALAVAVAAALLRPRSPRLPFLAPEIQARTWLNTEDRPRSLRAERGKVVLLEFWRFGCAMCQESVPLVEGWQRKYGPQGLVILTVHTAPRKSVDENDLTRIRSFLRVMHVRVPVAVDDGQKTLNAFGVYGQPTFMLVDRKGQVVYRVTGPYWRRIERAIEAVLRGERPVISDQ